jgi:hypothetical protein
VVSLPYDIGEFIVGGVYDQPDAIFLCNDLVLTLVACGG